MKLLLTVFSDGDNQLSWGRVGATVALGFVLHWVTRIVHRTSTIPDLTGCVMFVAGLYAIAKGPELIGAFFRKP